MAARLLRRAKPSGGRALPRSAFRAPPAPQRTLRSCFSLALAPEFPVSQRAQTQPCPSRPLSPCAGGPGTWRSPELPRPPGGTGQRRDGASPPRTMLRALASHRPAPCPRRLWGTKVCLRTPGISVVSAQPAHLNVLLVPSWHSLLPDRFPQSKHFGAKQLSSLSCRCGNHRAQCLEGCCGFSP